VHHLLWLLLCLAVPSAAQDLYQTPGIAASVNIHHIKTHYFTSHPALNTYAIIPMGGEPWWEQPHSRAAQFPDAKQP
jgi:putative glutathione S-transferase